MGCAPVEFLRCGGKEFWSRKFGLGCGLWQAARQEARRSLMLAVEAATSVRCCPPVSVCPECSKLHSERMSVSPVCS